MKIDGFDASYFIQEPLGLIPKAWKTVLESLEPLWICSGQHVITGIGIPLTTLYFLLSHQRPKETSESPEENQDAKLSKASEVAAGHWAEQGKTVPKQLPGVQDTRIKTILLNYGSKGKVKHRKKSTYLNSFTQILFFKLQKPKINQKSILRNSDPIIPGGTKRVNICLRIQPRDRNKPMTRRGL